MLFEFNKHGNLPNDLILACNEFKRIFGYNEEREKKINNLFTVANRLKQIGCDKMFVFGSFATQKENPNDVDVCFDISNLEVKVLEKNNSSFNKYELVRIKKYFFVHVILKRVNEEELLKFLKTDRNGNQRGIIEIDLKDLPGYDKK